MIFDRQNKPTDEAHIKDFEVSRGVTLPKDYRVFLLNYNGGRPADANSSFQPERLIWLSVEEFYGFTEDSLNDIASFRYNDFSDHIHARLLQVANTGSQGIYMDLREGPMHGKIYILARPANETVLVDDTGFEDDGDYDEARFLHPIANSWTEFVDMLGPEPPFDD
ncbi:SMI1/KNR4 family protein [Fontisubflavum oceani]|uniref:SMI1/KNR4 family protein n=1 Tax=Fontisubflavum oceani TaxID=2978973 RepID=UPI0025B4C229|nr:SMI1/KNR4 family protein [Fontisubflavum oceani]WJY21203.1 SMI1/KNR4 family protein [Fontisubflavum oceani]